MDLVLLDCPVSGLDPVNCMVLGHAKLDFSMKACTKLDSTGLDWLGFSWMDWIVQPLYFYLATPPNVTFLALISENLPVPN